MYYLIPYKDPEVFDHLVKGLTKAGYKGNSSDYYKLNKENKLTGQDIQELVFGKIIEGNIPVKTKEGKTVNIPWSITIDKSGESKYNQPLFGKHIYKGKAWVEGERLCRQYETLFDGMKSCAEIYKNPEGENKTNSEFFLLTDYTLALFSIKENH